MREINKLEALALWNKYSDKEHLTYYQEGDLVITVKRYDLTGEETSLCIEHETLDEEISVCGGECEFTFSDIK